MPDYNSLPTQETLLATKKALEDRGFAVTIVANETEATTAALSKIPKGTQVFTVTSATVDQIGLTGILNESGDYDAVRPKLYAPDSDASTHEAARLAAAAPQVVVGSVHGITHEGQIVVVSATGSQLPAYAYGAQKVIWVVGAQKVVKDLDSVMQRISEHIFPLEDARALKAYGIHSSINKTLIFDREAPGRIEIILVMKALGF